MTNRHRQRGGPTWILVALALVSFSAELPAAGTDAALPPALEQLRRQAFDYEEQGQWARAGELYEQILSKERNLPAIRERYSHSLRQARLVRRQRDKTFQQQVLTLSLTRALDVYSEVLTKLQQNYVDRDRVDLSSLVNQGLDELRRALNDQTFRQEHLPGIDPPVIQAYQKELQLTWGSRVVRRLSDALALAREVALSAQRALNLRPTVAVLELLCGACNSLDEHTAFLTPEELAEEYDSIKGQVVGVGLEVVQEEQKLFINRIIPGGPAELASLKSGDRLIRINRQATAGLPPEAAAELLRGEVGSVVELDVLAPGDREPRTVTLPRQAMSVPSVSEPRFLSERMYGIGYLQLVGFQETTLQELDDAVLKLQAAGMQVLLLDLRGNAGGLVDVAVQIAQRFLAEGVITSTQGQIRLYNRRYESHNMNPLTVPLVVLIDGETASSAEMVAGAFKDHRRGRLVGQTTFGKGSIQQYWRLSTGAGLRITVAKFFSPGGQPYSGNGVSPHLFVARNLMDLSMEIEHDPQVRAALDLARELLMSR